MQEAASLPKGSPWFAHLFLPHASPLLTLTHRLGGQVTLVPLLALGVLSHEHWQNPPSFSGWKPGPSTNHPPSFLDLTDTAPKPMAPALHPPCLLLRGLTHRPHLRGLNGLPVAPQLP